MKKKICIVINKWWEADPIMAVLTNDDVKPPSLGWPEILNYPRNHTIYSPNPRLVFDKMNNVIVDVWCISDLLAKFPQKASFQSSSERKMDVLPLIFGQNKYDLVIASGTAAHYPASDNRNGSVIIGSKIFLHNAHPNGSNPNSNWIFNRFEEKISSTITKELFQSITNFEGQLDIYLYPEKQYPGSPLTVDSDYENVDVHNINLTDYNEYEEKDIEALEAYSNCYNDGANPVLETTLGLVSVAAGLDVPFFYVAGIVDRVGHFADDVPDPPYAQNSIGSHNAGVVLANIIDRLEQYYTII